MNNAQGALEPVLEARVLQHLQVVYAQLLDSNQLQGLAQNLLEAMRLTTAPAPSAGSNAGPAARHNHWDQRDVLMICYGDSVVTPGEAPLRTLKGWLDQHSDGAITGVHILPFYPWSADDGFAVIDYLRVNDSLGDWPDVLAIGAKYDLMADLVINHCSGSSEWFENFLTGDEPGRDYFVTADPTDDLSLVVRPRTSPLLREVQTERGTQHVWCTFSHDQLDL
ncbi:MAG: alpha-amylase family glycosyl hydrolase, partial [Pseudomonadota bacterium]